jgi:NAD(P)-dependent dehydrogenase (short-subunit alcohol dehydrogenase family)
MTNDGFEVTFQANYLSNFLLTHLLLPHLERSKDGRVVLVSSAFHDPDRRMDLKRESLAGRRPWSFRRLSPMGAWLQPPRP